MSDRRKEDPTVRTRTTNVLAVVQAEGLPLDRQLSLVKRAMDQAKEAGEPTEQFEHAIVQLSRGGTDGDRS